MSRVLHVIPVGISLLHALDKKEMDNDVRTALKEALNPDTLRKQTGPESAPDVVRQAILAATSSPSGRLDLARLLPGLTDSLQALRKKPNLCAEWQSVEVDTSNPPAGDPDDGDPAYVFITTDTNEGMRAAAFLAAGFSGDTVAHYIDDPSAELTPSSIEPGHAYLCRAPGLNLAKSAEIADTTWRAIGDIGHVIAETGRQADGACWRVVLHLSGGYKAMIPYLLVMGEAINSIFKNKNRTVDGREPTLQAFALHDSADELRVDIPVRALQGGLFDELISLKEAHDSDKLDKLRSNGLLGLCVDNETGRLTTPGVIMVQVP